MHAENATLIYTSGGARTFYIGGTGGGQETLERGNLVKIELHFMLHLFEVIFSMLKEACIDDLFIFVNNVTNIDSKMRVKWGGDAFC